MSKRFIKSIYYRVANLRKYSVIWELLSEVDKGEEANGLFQKLELIPQAVTVGHFPCPPPPPTPGPDPPSAACLALSRAALKDLSCSSPCLGEISLGAFVSVQSVPLPSPQATRPLICLVEWLGGHLLAVIFVFKSWRYFCNARPLVFLELSS